MYSLDDDRVWLVGATNRVQRTFRVNPGNIDPPIGTYWVTSRSSAVTGSDGVPVEHVVRFTLSLIDVYKRQSQTGAERSARTGGIRETRANGDAMWAFATIGVRVVVIR